MNGVPLFFFAEQALRAFRPLSAGVTIEAYSVSLANLIKMLKAAHTKAGTICVGALDGLLVSLRTRAVAPYRIL